MNTPDTEWSSVKEQVYNLVKEVHIQKPFEDVTGEPHYVTDEIMKIFTTHSQNREAVLRNKIVDYIVSHSEEAVEGLFYVTNNTLEEARILTPEQLEATITKDNLK